jgi:hypothetical protein
MRRPTADVRIESVRRAQPIVAHQREAYAEARSARRYEKETKISFHVW